MEPCPRIIIHHRPLIVHEVYPRIEQRVIYVYRDVPAGWSYPALDRWDHEGFFVKGEVANEFITREMPLSATERRRVERLTDTGLLDQIVTADGREQENSYTYERVRSRLTVYAPMEMALRVETIVRDRRTFGLVTEGVFEEPLVLSILSVVHPAFLENDPSAARRLATENEDAIDDLLDDLSPQRRWEGKEHWLVTEVGTVVIVDTPENIARAETLIESRPYVPRSYVRDP